MVKQLIIISHFTIVKSASVMEKISNIKQGSLT